MHASPVNHCFVVVLFFLQVNELFDSRSFKSCQDSIVTNWLTRVMGDYDPSLQELHCLH